MSDLYCVSCGNHTDTPQHHYACEVTKTPDAVNNPSHYTWLGGIEVIDITEHLSFTLGNVVKYVLRADHKGKPIEDLRKAAWYLNREIARREANETA